MLVSISHFPPSGRPQAGLSFAPFVYEFSITGGETRFLAAFYGRFPEAQVPLTGDCQVRTGAFVQTARSSETACGWTPTQTEFRISMKMASPGFASSSRMPRGQLCREPPQTRTECMASTSETGQEYRLEFLQPAYLEFTTSNQGLDDLDSDVEPLAASHRVDHLRTQAV